MNEKIKMFFIGVGSAFAFIGSIICTTLFRTNRRTINTDVGVGIKQSGKTCESAKRTLDELTKSTESAIRAEQDIERTTEQLKESISTSRRILEKLKKRKSKK